MCGGGGGGGGGGGKKEGGECAGTIKEGVVLFCTEFSVLQCFSSIPQENGNLLQLQMYIFSVFSQ